MKRPKRYFRAGVGAVLAQDGRVLIFERADVRGAWQFPQGGLELDERPLDAVFREIQEETGIGRRSLVLLGRYPGLLAYELPRRAQSVKTGMGQVHYWFLFHVKHSVGHVILPPDSEFRAVARVSFRSAVRRAAPFKRPVYRQLLQEFGDAVSTLGAS